MRNLCEKSPGSIIFSKKWKHFSGWQRIILAKQIKKYAVGFIDDELVLWSMYLLHNITYTILRQINTLLERTMSERRVQDYIKKIDFSDMKVLLVGVVLLIIPLIVLYLVTGSGRSRKMSVHRMKTMVNRKKIFNFAQSGKKSGGLSSQAGVKASKSWLSQDPEKKVVRELEDAFKVVQRSTRRERFPPGTNKYKKQAYRAEHHPLITEATGKLEYGHLAEAEGLFAQAFEQAGNNVFQKVYALGGLCEVYSRQNNQQKYEQAFKLFTEWVAKLPPEAGGGDLSGAVRDAYMALKELKNSADPNKVGVELDKVDIIRAGQLSKSKVSRGLSKSLLVFPVKYD